MAKRLFEKRVASNQSFLIYPRYYDLLKSLGIRKPALHVHTENKNRERKAAKYLERKNILSAVVNIWSERFGKKPHICSTCGYSFTMKCALVKHVRVVHDKIKPFTCPRDSCDFSAGTKAQLERHVLTHDGVKPFECTFCTSKFYTKNEQKEHTAIVHEIRQYSYEGWPVQREGDDISTKQLFMESDHIPMRADLGKQWKRW